jgi:hypothetical protein
MFGKFFNKTNSVAIGIIILIALPVGAVGYIYFLQNSNKTTKTSITTSSVNIQNIIYSASSSSSVQEVLSSSSAVKVDSVQKIVKSEEKTVFSSNTFVDSNKDQPNSIDYTRVNPLQVVRVSDNEILLNNATGVFNRATGYEGGLFYDFKIDNGYIVRLNRRSYLNLKIDAVEKAYCYEDCPKFILNGSLKYSNFFNLDEVYKTYKEQYLGDVYEPFDNQNINIQKQ